MLLLTLAGPMTVIPLFLYVRGVELCGLGPTGMVFYITPTLQFLLGYFYYNEQFSLNKFVSFITARGAGPRCRAGGAGGTRPGWRTSGRAPWGS